MTNSIFSLVSAFECIADDINKLIANTYPQYKDFDIYESEEMDNHPLVMNVYSQDILRYYQDEFINGRANFMATQLLNKLCFDGIIEPGTYIIDGTW